MFSTLSTRSSNYYCVSEINVSSLDALEKRAKNAQPIYYISYQFVANSTDKNGTLAMIGISSTQFNVFGKINQ